MKENANQKKKSANHNKGRDWVILTLGISVQQDVPKRVKQRAI